MSTHERGHPGGRKTNILRVWLKLGLWLDSRLARPPVPPFNLADAVKKVRMAEDAWNTRNPEKVSLAYTQDGSQKGDVGPPPFWRHEMAIVQGTLCFGGLGI